MTSWKARAEEAELGMHIYSKQLDENAMTIARLNGEVRRLEAEVRRLKGIETLPWPDDQGEEKK